MKKILILFCAMSIVSIVSISCKNTVNGTKKTVGSWHHEVSRNMGGFQISANTELSIKRNGPGDYNYSISTTIVDDMYGGEPKTEYSSGKLDSVVDQNKWKFISGDFGDRGGYIVVPSDQWEHETPTEITVEFESGRGNSMTFTR